MGGATESELTDIEKKNSFLILTNNPLVAETLGERFLIEFLDQKSDIEVLTLARDRVHLGHRILTAPLSGSVKPGETPYRSLMMTAEASDSLDFFSLGNMERALSVLRHQKTSTRAGSSAADLDYQLVDLSLIESALPSLEAAGLA